MASAERTYTMSQKELDQITVIKQLSEKQIKHNTATAKLGISVRQVRRLKKSLQKR